MCVVVGTAWGGGKGVSQRLVQEPWLLWVFVAPGCRSWDPLCALLDRAVSRRLRIAATRARVTVMFPFSWLWFRALAFRCGRNGRLRGLFGDT